MSYLSLAYGINIALNNNYMHTLVITLKHEQYPIFPYSIRYDGEHLHYKTYENDLEHFVHIDNIAEIKLISIGALNMAIRSI